ncbi:MAG: PIN domain nuclease [Elusimicrobiota bacterium]|jgi:predicted nucleic acid-binding protein|nr:PIN domain nuclease [Elusimicrobiota bacterium]
MKKLKIYLDTSVISYLDQQDAPEKMAETKKFWNIIKSDKYDIVISEIVGFEVSKCNEPKHSVLIKYLKEINYKEISIDQEINNLAGKFVKNKILSVKSIEDCRHIASSLVSGCDVIVSWNFKHIVNYKTIKGVKVISLLEGYKEIVICAPSMLVGIEETK